MTVSELLHTMPNHEFVEWHAYFGLKSSKEKLAMRKAERGR